MSTSKTSLTLLDALRDPRDAVAWDRFDAGYRPMLRRFAASLGLNSDDADEAAQRAIAKFAAAHQRGQHDPKKGRFKNYLFTIARNEISDLLKSRARQPVPIADRSAAEDIAAQLSDPDTLSDIWDRQWRAHVLRLSLDRARTQFSSRDVEVFEQLALQDKSVQQVGQKFDLAPDAVRQIRHRVLKFLRSVKPEIDLAE